MEDKVYKWQESNSGGVYMMEKKRMLFIVFLTVLLSAALVFAAGGKTFKTKLTGADQVPPVMSKASGMAYFKLSPDGKEITYKLHVKNIMNVTLAHIHDGSMGKNGPPVVNLFTGPEKKGKFSGVLAKGTITDKDLVGPMQGKSLEDLVKMIEAGGTYVNVHTAENPGGEIRGQLK